MFAYLTFWGIITAPITWIMLVFGLIVGSFLNVCISRIPARTFWAHARSVCDHCADPVPWYCNVPVFSWIILRGKSACCQRKLSIQYPLVELLTGFLFVFIYYHFPFITLSTGEPKIEIMEMVRFFHALIFCCVMLVCSVIDFHHQIIPDVLSLPMVAVAPLVAALHPELSVASSLLGVLIGGGSLYFIAWVYYLIRREYGLGMGDVKLLAAIGGWLGYESLAMTVTVASIVGAVVGLLLMVVTRQVTLKSAIPFGPFLVLGALVFFFFGVTLNHWLLAIS